MSIYLYKIASEAQRREQAEERTAKPVGGRIRLWLQDEAIRARGPPESGGCQQTTWQRRGWLLPITFLGASYDVSELKTHQMSDQRAI